MPSGPDLGYSRLRVGLTGLAGAGLRLALLRLRARLTGLPKNRW